MILSLTNCTMQSINWHQEAKASSACMFIQVPLHGSLTRWSNLSHDLWVSACSYDDYDDDEVAWSVVNMISLTNCTMQSINWHQETNGEPWSGACMFIQVPLHGSLTRCSNLSHDLWISACSDDEYDNDKVIWCAVNMISFTNCTMLTINWIQAPNKSSLTRCSILLHIWS